MPWLLIPIVFLLSIEFSIEEDAFSLSYVLLPVSAALGLRYGERGLIVFLIGAFPLLFHLRIGEIHTAGDFSVYFMGLLLAAVASHSPQLFRPGLNKQEFLVAPLWILLILPAVLYITLESSSQFYFVITVGFYLLMPTYLYLRGLTQADKPIKVINYLTVLAIASFAIFSGNNGVEEVNNKFSVAYGFFFLSDFILAVTAYLIGYYHANFRDSAVTPKLRTHLIIVPLIILAHFNIKLFYGSLEQSIISGVAFLYLVSLFAGLASRWVGVLIVSIISLLFSNLIFLLENIVIPSELFGRLEITLLDNPSVAVEAVCFSIFGVLASTIKAHDINYKKIETVISKDALRLRIIHGILFSLPFIILVVSLIFSALESWRGFGEQLVHVYESPASLYFVVFLIIYIIIHIIPLELSNEIIERNGVKFNRINFPEKEYKEVHDTIDEIYGKDYFPIYVVDQSSILKWPFAARFYRMFAITNPVILSSTLWVVRENPKQLTYLLHVELAKVYLNHRSLWWYTYLLAFLPFLNFLYLYARRVTSYQAHLYAFLKTNDLVIAVSALSAKACSSIIKTVPTKDEAGIGANFMIQVIELFSPEPNLRNQINFLTYINDVQDNVRLKRVKYGYRVLPLEESSSLFKKIIRYISYLFIYKNKVSLSIIISGLIVTSGSFLVYSYVDDKNKTTLLQKILTDIQSSFTILKSEGDAFVYAPLELTQVEKKLEDTRNFIKKREYVNAEYSLEQLVPDIKLIETKLEVIKMRRNVGKLVTEIKELRATIKE